MMQQGIGRSSPAAQKRIGIRAIFLLLIMLAAVPVAMHAQAYYGSIVGNVTDSSGAAVVGAKVTAVDAATSVSFSATTSGIGGYTLAQLPLGVYIVKIVAPHFKESISTGVEVHVSTNTEVNAVLQCREGSARPIVRRAKNAEHEEQQRGDNDDKFPAQVLIHGK